MSGIIQPVAFGDGPDAVTLAIAEDAYQGDAQFTVSIDGQQIGGVQIATALFGAGQAQAFTALGDFGPGPTYVEVDFLNDAYAGTPDTDRNLYVDSITAGGTTANTDAALYSAGPADFVIPAAATAATATTYTFNGGIGAWTDPASWTPAGPPPNNDTLDAVVAAIPAGTVYLDGGTLDGITVQIGSEAADGSPDLVLADSTLGPAFEIDTVATDQDTGNNTYPVVTVEGTVVNEGTFSNGLTIDLASDATLVNRGTITDSSVASTGAQPGTLDNEGTVNVTSGNFADINAAVVGVGTFNVSNPGGMTYLSATELNLAGPVSSGQTINLQGASFLYVDDPADFAGTITASSSNAPNMLDVNTNGQRVTHVQFDQTSAAGGQLQVFAGGQLAASLTFAGTWSSNDFTVVPSAGLPDFIAIQPYPAAAMT